MTEHGEEWVECQIGYWHARLHGEFTAVYRGEAPWNNAGRSGRFRWIGGDGQPPRTRTAEARLEEFCRQLEQAGWERDREDAPDPWYELSFRRFVGLPDSPDRPQPRDELTPDRAPLSSLVSVEQPVEPLGGPAAEQEPEDAVDPRPLDPEPVDPEPPAAPIPVFAAPEDIVALPDPDLDPSPTVAEPAEPDEDVVGQPWYQAPAAVTPRQADPVDSELCARIGAYIGAAD